jgi:hypothetical protein
MEFCMFIPNGKSRGTQSLLKMVNKSQLRSRGCINRFAVMLSSTTNATLTGTEISSNI